MAQGHEMINLNSKAIPTVLGINTAVRRPVVIRIGKIRTPLKREPQLERTFGTPTVKPLLKENSQAHLMKILEEQVSIEAFKFSRTFNYTSSLYDVNDLKQEGYIAALRALRDFKEELGSFRTFCRTAVKNHFINILNSQTCMSRNERDNVAGVLEEEFDPSDQFSRNCILPINVSKQHMAATPEESFEKEEVLQALQRELPEEEVKVLNTILNPPAELYKLALDNYKRKKALKKIGVNCRGGESVRLTRQHIARFLGYTFVGLTKKLDNIRAFAEKLQADSKYVARTPILTEAEIKFPIVRTPLLRTPIFRIPKLRMPVLRIPKIRIPLLRIPVLIKPLELLRKPLLRIPRLRIPVVGLTFGTAPPVAA